MAISSIARETGNSTLFVCSTEETWFGKITSLLQSSHLSGHQMSVHTFAPHTEHSDSFCKGYNPKSHSVNTSPKVQMSSDVKFSPSGLDVTGNQICHPQKRECKDSPDSSEMAKPKSNLCEGKLGVDYMGTLCTLLNFSVNRL